MLKPNLGLIFLPIFLVRRQWSLLVGWIGGLTLLVSSTLPMGLRIWLDYACSFRTLATVVGTQIPMWKQQTIYAFWQSLPGMHQSSQALALWIASSLPLLAITAAAWLKMKPDAQHLPRLFSLTVLTIVSCNIYIFVYDGLLLALPGMVWYMDRGSYRYTGCRMVAGVAILVIYVWQHLTAWIIHGGWALVGPTVAIWLIADAWDLLRT